MIRRSAGFISGRAGSASSREGWYHCTVTSVSVLKVTALSDGLCGSGVLPGGGGTLCCGQQVIISLAVVLYVPVTAATVTSVYLMHT